MRAMATLVSWLGTLAFKGWLRVTCVTVSEREEVVASGLSQTNQQAIRRRVFEAMRKVIAVSHVFFTLSSLTWWLLQRGTRTVGAGMPESRPRRRRRMSRSRTDAPATGACRPKGGPSM